MKCSKFIILFIIFAFSALAQENFVIPKNNTNFTNGDTTTLLIESPLSDEELKKFENTKITDVIYVFKFSVENGEREFEVIFSDPPKKPSEKEKPFTAKGITYNFDKERAGDRFVIFDSKFSHQIESENLGIIICLLLLFLLITPLVMIIRNFSELRSRINQKKEMAQKLIETFNMAKKREQLEAIYQKRNEYQELVQLPEDSWSKFLEKINSIQFQSSWDVNELDEVLNLKKKVGALEIKNGI